MSSSSKKIKKPPISRESNSRQSPRKTAERRHISPDQDAGEPSRIVTPSRTLYDPNAPPKPKFELYKRRNQSGPSPQHNRPTTAPSTGRSVIKLKSVFDVDNVEIDNAPFNKSVDPKQEECRLFLDKITKRENEIKSTDSQLPQDVGRHLELIELHHNLLMMNASFFVKHDLEARCWRYGVYKVIEEIRHDMKANKLDIPASRKFLLDAISFYEIFTVTFKAVNLLDSKDEKEYRVGHRTWSYLGDLCRYMSQMVCQTREEKQSFGDRAVACYRKAICLAPGQGFYVNQIAVMYCYQKNFFQSIEYYLLSLLSSVPFPSAYDSLALLLGRLKQGTSNSSALHLTQSSFIRILEIVCTRVDVDDLLPLSSLFHVEGGQYVHEDVIIHMYRISALALIYAWNYSLGDTVKQVLVQGSTQVMARLLESILNQQASEKDLSKDFLDWLLVLWISSPRDLMQQILQPMKKLTTTFQSNLIEFLSHLAIDEESKSVSDYQKYLGDMDQIRTGIPFFSEMYRLRDMHADMPSRLDGLSREVLEILCELGWVSFVSSAGNYQLSSSTGGLKQKESIFDAFQDLNFKDGEEELVFLDDLDQFPENLVSTSLDWADDVPSKEGGTVQNEIVANHQSEKASPAADENNDEASFSEEDLTDDDVEMSPEMAALKAKRNQLQKLAESTSPGVTSFLSNEVRQAQKESKRLRGSSSSEPEFTFGRTVLVIDTNVWLSCIEKLKLLYETGGYMFWIPLAVVQELRSLSTATDRSEGIVQSSTAALTWMTTQLQNSTAGKKMSLRTLKGNALDVAFLSLKEDYDPALYRTIDDVILASCHSMKKQMPDSYMLQLVTEDKNMAIKARADGIPVLSRIGKLFPRENRVGHGE